MKTTEPKSTSATTSSARARRPASFFGTETEAPFFSEATRSTRSPFTTPAPPPPFFSSTGIQAKLTIGQPGDKYEQEADATADKVLQRKCAVCDAEEEGIAPKLQRKPIFESQGEEKVQRKCAACEATERISPLSLQRSGQGAAKASPELESRLNATRGSGSPIPEATRTQMESSFGTDFSGVRVHTDSSSVQMNRELGAQAFTHGSNIYFNRGKYAPGSSGGRHLLAHELTHVVQQGGSGIQTKANKRVSNTNSSGEESERIQRLGIPGTDLEIPGTGGYEWDLSVRGVKNAAGIAADTAMDLGEGALELGADALMAIVERIAPELAELIRKGPKAMLTETFGEGIENWLKGLLGGLDLSTITADIRGGLAEAFKTIQGVLTGDTQSCEAFANGIEAIRNLIAQFTDNPVIDALKTAFDTISSFVKKVSSLILTPVFDALKEIGGGIFDGIKALADQIWKWGKAVKNFLSKAWDWVMEQLGIPSEGEGGIWEWIKGIANDIWLEIKETFGPIIEPIQNILKVMVVLSPVGPFIVAVKYGPQIVESVKWLWANKDNPDIVKSAHEEMGHTILPQLLSSVQGFFEGFQSGVNEFVSTLTQLGTHLLEFIGGVTGVPILSFLQTLAQTISDGVKDLISWGQETLTKAVGWVKQKYLDFKEYIDPLVEVLTSLTFAATNPHMIPIILAGWAWRLLPCCYKPPIIDFLLDAIIGILKAIPALPILGLLWPLLKPAMIGLLEGFKNRTCDEKIEITDKMAKIASGASPAFMWGFVKGFLRGVWEGITDPFVLMFMAIDGLSKLMGWFNSMMFGEEEAVAGAKNDAKAAPAGVGVATASAGRKEGRAEGSPPPDLIERLGEMGTELEPPVEQVTENFRPAVTSHFKGSGNMTFEQMVNKMGDMWSFMEGKIQESATDLANEIFDFMLKDSAEEKMGEGVGWLAGTIVFEVILAILTAGSATAAKGIMKVLKYFAKILDWTGEVLGVAFKLLSKLGRYLFKIVKGIGKVISKAKGPLKIVLNALQEIGEKLVRFGDELFGKFAKEAAGEATEKVGKETAETAADKAAKEAAGEATEKAGKETSEKAADKAAKEAAGEAGEKGAKVEPLSGDVKAMAASDSGHKISITENGKIIRCSPKCAELEKRYVLELKNPKNKALAEELERVKAMPEGQAKADAAAALEAKLGKVKETGEISGKRWDDPSLTKDEMVADYKAENPTSRLTDKQLGAYYDEGIRVNPETGALKRPPTTSPGPGWKEDWEPPKNWNGPQKHGDWDGPKGNSAWYDERPEIIRIVGEGSTKGKSKPIIFYKGKVDFSSYARETFEVKGLVGTKVDSNADMKIIMEELARKKNLFKPDGTPNQAAARRWLRSASDGYGGTGLAPHHAGGDVIELVPSALHNLQHTDISH